jgi:hypothetical protein
MKQNNKSRSITWVARMGTGRYAQMFDKSDHGEGDADEVRWLESEPARKELRKIVARFFEEHKNWVKQDERDKPPALGLKASAGLGKTHAALECIKEYGSGFLDRGHILFYVPTLDLAVDAEAKFRKLEPKLPSMVLRGRGAINPKTGIAMCARSDYAKAIASSVESVTEAICQKRMPWGEVRKAPCAKRCPYLTQRRRRKNQVVFLSHAYLTSRPPLSGEVALRIIDEKFWSELAETRKLKKDDWETVSKHIQDAGLEKKFNDVTNTVAMALKEGRPVFPSLLKANISQEDLLHLAHTETSAAPGLKIDPNHSDSFIDQIINKFDRDAAIATRKRAQIFDLLAQKAEFENTERLSLEKPGKHNDRTAFVKLHLTHELPDTAPLLLMDADLDETVVTHLCPNVKVEQISVRPEAEIVQIRDRTLSCKSLTVDWNARDLRDKVAEVIKREVVQAKGKDVLAVATKKVLTMLFDDVENGPDFDESTQQPQKLHGATTRWYGPRMLGVNKFEDYATIILIGRMQPNVAAIEDGMRALFGDSEHPLLFSEDGNLTDSRNKLDLGSGEIHPVRVQIHPDPRGQAVLAQNREAQSEQAVARLRLLSGREGKRVIILSNVPLPGLPADELISFEALAADKSDFRVSAKYKQLELAIMGADLQPLDGLRLSKAGLKLDAPHAFPKKTSGENFRKDLSTRQVLSLAKSVSEDLQLPATPVLLSSIDTGGRPVPSVVFAASATAISRAEKLWPGYSAKKIDWEGEPLDERDEVIETP